ncbi:MAG: hypothetical protein VX820_04905 [Candidatus Neomarinimicrobiota bacterium]|nr:hypothetical protein [Candidatus Neomarinimicrobiota bacterium]
MPKKSFIKVLLERRIPQILGSYLVAGTSLILFIEYLVGKYQFPSHYPTLSLFALIGILPSVIILSYFHGAPGKDEWTKVEKVGIPINIFFIAVILFFGDSLNVWNYDQKIEEEKHTISVIHFTSLSEHKELFGSNLDIIDDSLLDSLRTYFNIQLMNWFYSENKSFTIPEEDMDIDTLNQNPMLSVHWNSLIDDEFSKWYENTTLLFEKFNKPNYLIYFNIYQKYSSEKVTEYFVTFSGMWERPGNNYAESFSVETTSELFQKIGNELRGIFGDKRKIGTVSKVNDDIVFVKLSDIDVRRNMQLTGWSTYSFGPGNDGYKNSLEDFNNAINYMKKSDKDYTSLLNQYEEFYTYLLSDTLYCNNGCVQTRSEQYTLQVLELMDSVAVTKIIDRYYPWVKIRNNDYVYILPN